MRRRTWRRDEAQDARHAVFRIGEHASPPDLHAGGLRGGGHRRDTKCRRSAIEALSFVVCGAMAEDLRRPVPSKEHLLLINNFIIESTRFLNHFSSVAEEKLRRVSSDIARIEKSLVLVESKLRRVPGLEDIDAAAASGTLASLPDVAPAPAAGAAGAPAPPASTPTASSAPPPPTATAPASAPAAPAAGGAGGGAPPAPAPAPAPAAPPAPAVLLVKDDPVFVVRKRAIFAGTSVAIPPGPTAHPGADVRSGSTAVVLHHVLRLPSTPCSSSCPSLRDDAQPFFKMLKVGVPEPAVMLKMGVAGLNPQLLLYVHARGKGLGGGSGLGRWAGSSEEDDEEVTRGTVIAPARWLVSFTQDPGRAVAERDNHGGDGGVKGGRVCGDRVANETGRRYRRPNRRDRSALSVWIECGSQGENERRAVCACVYMGECAGTRTTRLTKRGGGLASLRGDGEEARERGTAAATLQHASIPASGIRHAISHPSLPRGAKQDAHASIADTGGGRGPASESRPLGSSRLPRARSVSPHARIRTR